MSTFSDHLNKLIKKKNLTLPYLEKESGFSTALISKIKTGKRLPESEEKMIKLIQALHCSVEKEKELIKEYRIAKMGIENYLCTEEIRKTIESLSQYSTPISLNRKTECKFEISQIISGENNINTMLQYLVEDEITNNSGVFRMILPSESHFWEDCLIQALSFANSQSLNIEHIISLLEPNEDDFPRENIKTVNSCLRLASIYRNQYKALYTYKAEPATDFFPYCILTSKYGLLISSDYQHAIFIWEATTLEVLNQMFEKIIQKCRPLLNMSEDAIGYLLAYSQCLWQSPLKDHRCSSISYVPCILSTIPPEIAMQRMNPKLKKIPLIVDLLKKYWTEVSIAETITIFSLKGLELFMETGICYELPEASCEAFSFNERVTIMKHFIIKAEQGKITPILLKENQIKISPKLSITIYDSSIPVFIWNPSDVPFSSCFLQEDGIRNNLIDFLTYIRENEDDTYSPQESLAILKEHMKKYN